MAVPAWACLPFSLVGRAGRGAPPSPARKELLLRQLQGFFHRLASAALGVVCVCVCVFPCIVCVFFGAGAALPPVGKDDSGVHHGVLPERGSQGSPADQR